MKRIHWTIPSHKLKFSFDYFLNISCHLSLVTFSLQVKNTWLFHLLPLWLLTHRLKAINEKGFGT